MAEDKVPAETTGTDPEDLDAVADRLEAALERIARQLGAAKPAPPSAELLARLDGMIERLRDVLGAPEGASRDQGSTDRHTVDRMTTD